ncbi:hypothetical protein K1T71_012880 [Dendrolimus kikuchii]|uniref:Uncharacterized protein n=1 Tax=Dendrolimus kikuchii TaxID=765133 RepID=A0ACC1CIC7_9NEOP|nr:hypothetical protein K1T71_012880 [Dendrolimus kikuchii]
MFLLTITLVTSSWCVNLTFPPSFKFGAATAAYQVEGAWNVSDKGEGIWDRLVHEKPWKIADGSNGDVACDSYHLWERDIEMAVEMGLQMYRLSISWPRLLPNGFANYISEDGKNYYNNLIDGLLKNNIEPVVTLYHFDLPQILQDLGGWANPYISDWFADYARVVFSLYADRVKTWITINEPLGVCDGGFADLAAPGVVSPVGVYLCTKNIVVAHAKAWRIYDKEYKPLYHGQLSLSSLFFWFYPSTRTEEDEEAAELARQYMDGKFSHPIYTKEGGWPPSVEKIITQNSIKEGYSRSKLPPFSQEEIELVKGTYDYFALNYYTSRLVRRPRPGEKIGVWPFNGTDEMGLVFEAHPAWELAGAPWFSIVPEGVRDQISWIRQNYNNVSVLVTENGFGSTDHGLHDGKRSQFIKSHLEQLLLSIKEDGADIQGYIAWTLMQNYEWYSGYTFDFGLYHVDHNSSLRTRTPRDSAKYYASVIKARSLNVPIK